MEAERRSFERDHVINLFNPPFLTTTAKLIPKFNNTCVVIDDALFAYWREKKEREISLAPTFYEKVVEGLEEIFEQMSIVGRYIKRKIQRIIKKLRILIKIDKYAGEGARDRIIIYKKNQKIAKYSRKLRILFCHLDARFIDPVARVFFLILGYLVGAFFFLCFPIVAFACGMVCRLYFTVAGSKVRPALQRRKLALAMTLDDNYEARLKRKTFAARITSKAFHFTPVSYREFISHCHSYYCAAKAAWTQRPIPYAKERALRLEKEALRERREYLAVYYVSFRRQLAFAKTKRRDEKYDALLDLRERRRIIDSGGKLPPREEEKGWLQRRREKKEREIRAELESRLRQYSLSHTTDLPIRKSKVGSRKRHSADCGNITSDNVFADSGFPLLAIIVPRALRLAHKAGTALAAFLDSHSSEIAVCKNVAEWVRASTPLAPPLLCTSSSADGQAASPGGRPLARRHESKEELHNRLYDQIQREYRQFIKDAKEEEERAKRATARAKLKKHGTAGRNSGALEEKSEGTTGTKANNNNNNSGDDKAHDNADEESHQQQANKKKKRSSWLSFIPFVHAGVGGENKNDTACGPTLTRTFDALPRTPGVGPQTVAARAVVTLMGRTLGEAVRGEGGGAGLAAMRTSIVIIHDDPLIDLARFADADIPIAVTLSDQYQNALLVQRLMEAGDAAIIAQAFVLEAIDVAAAAEDDVAKNNKVKERDQKYEHRLGAKTLKRWEQQRRDLGKFARQQQSTAMKQETRHARVAMKAERKWREKVQKEQFEAHMRQREIELGGKENLKKQLKIERAQEKERIKRREREEKEAKKMRKEMEKVRAKVRAEQKESKKGGTNEDHVGFFSRIGLHNHRHSSTSKQKSNNGGGGGGAIGGNGKNGFFSPTLLSGSLSGNSSTSYSDTDSDDEFYGGSGSDSGGDDGGVGSFGAVPQLRADINHPSEGGDGGDGDGVVKKVGSAVTYPAWLLWKGAKKLVPAGLKGKEKGKKKKGKKEGGGEYDEFYNDDSEMGQKSSFDHEASASGHHGDHEEEAMYDDFFNFNVDDVADDLNHSRSSMSQSGMSDTSSFGSPSGASDAASPSLISPPPSGTAGAQQSDGSPRLGGRSRRSRHGHDHQHSIHHGHHTRDPNFVSFFPKENFPHFGIFGHRFFDRRKERELRRQKRLRERAAMRQSLITTYNTINKAENEKIAASSATPHPRSAAADDNNNTGDKHRLQFLRSMFNWRRDKRKLSNSLARLSAASPRPAEYDPFVNPDPAVITFYSHGHSTFFPSTQGATAIASGHLGAPPAVTKETVAGAQCSPSPAGATRAVGIGKTTTHNAEDDFIGIGSPARRGSGFSQQATVAANNAGSSASPANAQPPLGILKGTRDAQKGTRGNGGPNASVSPSAHSPQLGLAVPIGAASPLLSEAAVDASAAPPTRSAAIPKCGTFVSSSSSTQSPTEMLNSRARSLPPSSAAAEALTPTASAEVSALVVEMNKNIIHSGSTPLFSNDTATAANNINGSGSGDNRRDEAKFNQPPRRRSTTGPFSLISPPSSDGGSNDSQQNECNSPPKQQDPTAEKQKTTPPQQRKPTSSLPPTDPNEPSKAITFQTRQYGSVNTPQSAISPSPPSLAKKGKRARVREFFRISDPAAK